MLECRGDFSHAGNVVAFRFCVADDLKHRSKIKLPEHISMNHSITRILRCTRSSFNAVFLKKKNLSPDVITASRPSAHLCSIIVNYRYTRGKQ